MEKNMIRNCLNFFVCMTVFVGVARAETIVTHEEEKYFYQEGKIQRFEGQYENTYQLDLEKDELIRTRIYDYQTKEIIPDETVYHIEKDLKSHPTTAFRYSLEPMIRAVGQPDKDSVETIMIQNDVVETATST